MKKPYKDIKDLKKTKVKKAAVVILGVSFMLTPLTMEAASDLTEHSFQNVESVEIPVPVTASFDSVDFELSDNQEDANDKWNLVLDDLAEYTYDWDGEGAKAISATTIANCKSLLNETYKYGALLDDIFPTELGTVCIQWYDHDADALVNVEISAQSMAFYADAPGRNLYDFRPAPYGADSIESLVSVLESLS